MNITESIFKNLRDNKINEGNNNSLNNNLDETIILNICPNCDELFEGVEVCPQCNSNLDEKIKLVVRDGKVIKKEVKKKKNKKLSSAQRQALAKARKKAHTSSANKNRAKSLKKRSRINDSNEDYLVCPECGYEGLESEFLDGDEYKCPDCGVDLELENESKSKSNNAKNESLAIILETLNVPSDITEAFNNNDMNKVEKYLKQEYSIEL